MKLHGLPIAPPSQIAIITAYTLGIDLEVVPVDMKNGEHKTEEYLKVNPLGQVPALVDGDFTLGESVAIAKYLLTKGDGETLYPADPKEQAKVEQVLLNALANLFKRHAAVFYTGFVRENFFGGEASTKEELAPLIEELNLGVENLKKFLVHNGGPFLTGEKFSLGDIVSYAFLNNSLKFGLFSLEAHPEV